jgi:hypothetical protein
VLFTSLVACSGGGGGDDSSSPSAEGANTSTVNSGLRHSGRFVEGSFKKADPLDFSSAANYEAAAQNSDYDYKYFETQDGAIRVYYADAFQSIDRVYAQDVATELSLRLPGLVNSMGFSDWTDVLSYASDFDKFYVMESAMVHLDKAYPDRTSFLDDTVMTPEEIDTYESFFLLDRAQRDALISEYNENGDLLGDSSAVAGADYRISALRVMVGANQLSSDDTGGSGHYDFLTFALPTASNITYDSKVLMHETVHNIIMRLTYTPPSADGLWYTFHEGAANFHAGMECSTDAELLSLANEGRLSLYLSEKGDVPNDTLDDFRAPMCGFYRLITDKGERLNDVLQAVASHNSRYNLITSSGGDCNNPLPETGACPGTWIGLLESLSLLADEELGQVGYDWQSTDAFFSDIDQLMIDYLEPPLG